MRPLTLASIIACSLGCTVPTTSSMAGCFTDSIRCTFTLVGGNWSLEVGPDSCCLLHPVETAARPTTTRLSRAVLRMRGNPGPVGLAVWVTRDCARCGLLAFAGSADDGWQRTRFGKREKGLISIWVKSRVGAEPGLCAAQRQRSAGQPRLRRAARARRSTPTRHQSSASTAQVPVRTGRA
jgi:hypothetical protein